MNERRIITASEAERYLGIPAVTVRSWAHRGQIHAVAIARRGQRWYRLADILILAA
jgi:DNA-binding transcriptional MerR regulator